jgi:hypothetical protein|tara:strand:+ start:644 stop:922 length:279 start_codon:yes stop_codon:yes gene_type:complete
MTEKFSKIMEDLGHQSSPDIGPDFEAGIWSRVSQIESRQLARGRNGLAAIMLVTALSVGMISGGNEAIASSGSSYLSDGPDYSPATLLHILP